MLIVEIVTPQSVIFSGNASSVAVPGSQSPFQVLYNHAPIVSSLDPGYVKINNENNSINWFVVSSGFTEVKDNKVSVLVERALSFEEIDQNKLTKELELLQSKKQDAKEESEIATIKSDIAFVELCLNAKGR